MDPRHPTISRELRAAIRRHAPRFRRAGWALVAVGVLAALFPLASSVVFKAILGWLMLISGAVMLFVGFQARDWASALMSGAIGVLYLAVGVYLAFFMFTGLIGLTVVLALSFLLQGGFELIIALQNAAIRGRRWLFISGAVSAGLGVMLLAGLPGTASWALGLILGLNIATSGASFLALARNGAPH